MTTEFDINEHVNRRATGEIVRLPRWAMWCLYASQVIGTPVFLVPAVIMSATVGIATGFSAFLSALSPWFAVPLAIMATSTIVLLGTCAMTSRDMAVSGALEPYLSLLASDTRFGRFLVRRFGAAISLHSTANQSE